MAAFRMLRRALVPTSVSGVSASLAWAATVYAKEFVDHDYPTVIDDESKPGLEVVNDEHCKTKRPSDLPIYGDSKKCDYYCEPPSKIQGITSDVRKQCTESVSQYQGVAQACKNTCSSCLEATKDACGMLNQPDSGTMRAGAIAGGGVVGAMLGFRGGIVRKLFLASLGSGGVAVALYPTEAMELGQTAYCVFNAYAKEAYCTGKKYAMVAYNFVNGPKDDCEPPKKAPPKNCCSVIPPVTTSIGLYRKDPSCPEDEPPINRDQCNPEDKDMYTLRS